MNTPSICRRQTGCAGATMTVLTLLVMAGATGCGYSQGALLYMLGVGQGKKIPAKFTLTESPVMILVDDPGHRMDSPQPMRLLFDELSQSLLVNEAAKRIVPLTTIEHLQQSESDFAKLSAREIGERGGAEQVLWIEVRDYLGDEQIADANIAAFFNVTVKVLNVQEKTRRSRVRLWPTSPDGHHVSATLTGSEVTIHKTSTAIAKELSTRLATSIAKLFYERRLEDFEREQ